MSQRRGESRGEGSDVGEEESAGAVDDASDAVAAAACPAHDLLSGNPFASARLRVAEGGAHRACAKVASGGMNRRPMRSRSRTCRCHHCRPRD